MNKKSLNFKYIWKRALALLIILFLLLTLNASDSNALGDYKSINLLDSKKTLTQIYTSQNYFGGTTYHSIAFDFHIFAEDVELNAHTNGNIAAYNLNARNNGFGADEKNHLNKREDNYIGKSAMNICNIASNGYIVIGRPVSNIINRQDKRVTLGNSNNQLDQSTSLRIYQETPDSSLYIDISRELAKLQDISKKLSYKETSPDVIIGKTENGVQNIQVSESGGNHYINISALDLYDNNGKRTLNISLPAKTTLIINVDMKNSNPSTLKNLVVNLNNYTNGEAIAGTYCGLLWNLYDSSAPNRQYVPCNYAQVGMSDYFFGTILAPCANITYGAVNGSIIAKRTKQGGKESHRFDFTGYEDPSNDCTTEITTENTTENTTEVTTEITTESTTEITTETTTETTTEITSEITSENTSEVTTEITTELTTETTTEITTESTSEDTTEITTEITTELTTETTTENTTEATTENPPDIPATTEATTCVPNNPTTETPTAITTTEINSENTTTQYRTTTSSTCKNQEVTQKNNQHTRTGDETRIFLWSILGIVSFGIFVTLVIYRICYKKK
ncbi:MAG: hypothetical protein ACI4GW_06670 [Lachnospiraceae bacterium]